MRDLFINGFELLVGLIVILLSLGVVITAILAFAGRMGPDSGPLTGVGILIGGGIYVIFLGGLMYMGLGIYQNTKRSADLLERIANK